MASYNYNEEVSFDLPYDYELQSEINDDGDEVFTIRGEFYLDDDLERQSKYSCRISEGTVDWNEEVAGKTMLQLWEDGFSGKENIKYASLQDRPGLMFTTMGQSMLIFGRELRMMATTVFAEVSHNKFLILIGMTPYNEDDLEKDEKAEVSIEKMRKIVESIRIDGKKVYSGIPDSRSLYAALEPCFDGSEPIDTGIKLNITVNGVGSSTTYEYGSDGNAPAITKFQLNYATPDEKLYPHYSSMKFGPAAMLSMMGAQVNATGTEYSFQALSKELDTLYLNPEDGPSEEQKDVLRRIVDADTGYYNLHEKAEQMIPLFRVDPSVFDAKHDRECELADGLMHRSYMMSALRSFAWSLSDWCVQKGVEPADLEFNEINQIVSFVSMQSWLNYDETYCNGLCGCPDLHVYYVPDGTSYLDKQALLPSAEQLAEIETIKEKFPNFNQILTTVHSLDSLRKDLEYIFPAIETVYAQLEAERDRMQALTGDVADILYAWCALALAAKEPFFSEDGPMNCWFEQKDSHMTVYRGQTKGSATPKQKSGGRRGPSKGCFIDGGKLLQYMGEDTEVVTPPNARVIGGSAFFGENITSIEFAEGTEKLESYSVSNLECLERVTLPESLRIIGNGALTGNDKLTRLVVPKGVHTIEDTAFAHCENLDEVIILGENVRIGTDVFTRTDKAMRVAFAGKNVSFKDNSVAEYVSKLTVFAPVGSTAEAMCKKRAFHFVPWDGILPLPSAEDLIPDEPVPFPNVSTVVPLTDFELEDGAIIDYLGTEKSFELPAGIKRIRASALRGKSLRIVKIPDGYTDIDPYAFGENEELEAILLPNTLKAVTGRAFCECKRMEQIVIPASVAYIDEAAFEGCINLRNIFVCGTQITFGWKALDTGCAETVIHGKAGSDIEAYCKENNLTFKAWNPPAPPRIDPVDKNRPRRERSGKDFVVEGSVLVAYNGKDGSIAFPEGITEIGPEAFADCVELTAVTIPNGITAIRARAFLGCSELMQVTIPASVKIFGEDIFAETRNPRVSVQAGSYAEQYGKLYKWPLNVEGEAPLLDDDFDIQGYKLAKYNGSAQKVIIPADRGIRHIQAVAFYNNSSIEEIVIPEGVESIAESAFSNCHKLSRVTLPESLRILNGFSYCESLEQITIPQGVEVIGQSAFYGTGLKHIVVPNGVTRIGLGAFGNCESIQSMTIPASVKTIGTSALPFLIDGEYVIHVAPGSAAEKEAKQWHCVKCVCDQLPESPGPMETKEAVPLTESSLEDFEIEDGTLVDYQGTASHIIIPDGVKRIDEYAFYHNQHVRKVTFPATLESIGDCAFDGTSLEDVFIPDTVTKIGESAFATCIYLEHIRFPKDIKRLAACVCEGCFRLKEINIPMSVKEIGSSAFEGCNTVEQVVIPKSVETLESGAFTNYWHTIFHVHKGSAAEAYCQEEYLEFDNEIPLTPEEIERRRKEAEEAERKRKEAEEQERIRKAAEEAERKRKAEEEAERRRKAAEEAELRRQRMLAEKRARYNEINEGISMQMQIIAQNKGWFGAQAKARKAAQEQLAILQAQLTREFPNGRP